MPLLVGLNSSGQLLTGELSLNGFSLEGEGSQAIEGNYANLHFEGFDLNIEQYYIDANIPINLNIEQYFIDALFEGISVNIVYQYITAELQFDLDALLLASGSISHLSLDLSLYSDDFINDGFSNFLLDFTLVSHTPLLSDTIIDADITFNINLASVIDSIHCNVLIPLTISADLISTEVNNSLFNAILNLDVSGKCIKANYMQAYITFSGMLLNSISIRPNELYGFLELDI